ncbi:hypothetical protein [Endozoicomonas sp. ALB091]|uniref:hypothetical protein n=1 Tax=Endozoicomonas sp. ALB091 TaxID=3403073 RepID=UPI003BB66F20
MKPEPVDQQEVDRLKRIDIPHWINGGTNFTSKLFVLIQTSDPDNKWKIKQVFPNEVEALRQWNEENLHEPGTL